MLKFIIGIIKSKREQEKTMKRLAGIIISLSLVCSGSTLPIVHAEDTSNTSVIKYNYGDGTFQRQMETLNRGLVAIKTNNGVYLSWRLLGTEASVPTITKSPDFDVYKNGNKIATVTDSTNYLDYSGTTSDKYTVTVSNTTPTDNEISVQPQNYFDIPLDIPADYTYSDSSNTYTYSYAPGDASCGDLDGDGEYEIVVKWEANPKDNSSSGVTGNVYLDAYKLNGTKLWRIDLGENIRAGAHYTQFLVYDFDLDGKAEITCKTAPGSKDASGAYVTAVSNINAIKNSTDNQTLYRNSGGYILTGPEYFTAFDGETGNAIDTIYYPNERISASVWGDNYGNRCDRFIADVAYLDGELPYAVYVRGYYFGQSGYSARSATFGARLVNGRLEVPYIFDTLSGQPGYSSGNENYIGQGNHNMTVADVDGDGKDEYIIGAACFEVNDNNKLVGKWTTQKGHGDALHIGDYDPTHHGLEFFAVHEVSPWGMSVIDPKNGEILFTNPASKDTGRGLMANVGAGGYYQISASSGAGNYIATGNNIFTSSSLAIGYNFRIFWDGDLYDNTLDGITVSDYQNNAMRSVFTATGCVSVNGTKSTPALQADLFGDWREELVYPTSGGNALRVFSTTDLTSYKIPTLMHDPVYRSGVAAEQSAYNQPPHIGFYLADEIFKPTVESISIESTPDKTTYKIGDLFDATGLRVMANFSNNTSEEISGYVISGFDSSKAGTQTITVSYALKTATFNVTVDSGFTINSDGYITGFTLNDTTATVPEEIDGVKVRGILDNALKYTNLTRLLLTASEFDLSGDEIFPLGITLVCYSGSDVYSYAIEHDIAVELIDTRDYIINIGFDESSYSAFQMLQTNRSQTKSIGHILYGVGSRGRGGDGNSGFRIVTDNANNTVLSAQVGRFSDSGRNAYFNLLDMPMLTNAVDSVIETKVYFPSGQAGYPRLDLLDDNAVTIDSISPSNLNIEYDTWYTYQLIYHEGTFYRVLKKDGELSTITELGTKTSTEFGVTNFKVLSQSGTLPGNNQRYYMYLDDFKVYTNTELANFNITVKNPYGKPVYGAAVKVNNTEYTTDLSGVAQGYVEAGTATVTVSADGYLEDTVTIPVFNTKSISKTILLRSENEVAVTGIEFEDDEISLKVGDSDTMQVNVLPSNADDKTVKYSSSDTSVATVDTASGKIRAVSNGSAYITVASVSNPTISNQIRVNVYNDDYTSTLSSIKISGNDTFYIPNMDMQTTAKFVAKCYDQYGVKMNAPIEWDVSGDLSTSDGVIKIPAHTTQGVYTVTATSGDITTEKYIIISSPTLASNMIAHTAHDEEFSVWQTTVDMTYDAGDIIYHSGARGSGGDNISGVTSGTSLLSSIRCMTLSAGRFSTSNRGAGLEFVNAPAYYDDSKDYVLDTDIFFDNLGMTTVSYLELYDTSNALIGRFNYSTLDINEKEWYHIAIVYDNGEYLVHIFDKDGGYVSTKTLTNQSTSTLPIKYLRYNAYTVGSGSQHTAVDILNLKYYESNKAVKLVTVLYTDDLGNPIPDATIKIGNLTSETTEAGLAGFDLPNGVYRASVYDGDTLIDSKQIYVTDTSSTLCGTLIKNSKLGTVYADYDEFENNLTVYNYTNDTFNESVAIKAIYNADGSLYRVEYKPLPNIEKLSSFSVSFTDISSANQTTKLMFWDSMDTMKTVLPIIN